MPEAADLVVIGAGPGGTAAAMHGAGLGRSVILVDSAGEAGVGGVCLLEGCIPSKALIQLADHHASTEIWHGLGLAATEAARPDLSAFQGWKKDVVQQLGTGLRHRLKAVGVEVLNGKASFIGPRTMLIVNQNEPPRTLEFRHAVVATGSEPVPIVALGDDPRLVTPADVLNWSSLPDRVVVVGAGYIGLELGTALRKLGTDVTFVESGERILPGLPADVAAPVARRLRELGCVVHTSASAVAMELEGLHVEGREGQMTVPTDAVLVATGRRPRTTDVGLATTGAHLSPDGFIDVGPDLLATSAVAAIGDVVAGPGLAHRATAHARTAVEALCGRRVSFDAVIPTVVFSDPEIATVGMDLAEATRAGHRAKAHRLPMGYAGRTLLQHNTRGFAQVVYDEDSRLLLGAQLVGVHAGELISELALAVECAITVEDLAQTVHPHPTTAEIWWETAAAAGRLT